MGVNKAESIRAEDSGCGRLCGKTPDCFALAAQLSAVRKMTAGWPRRGHKLLELYCGEGIFLEAFWQYGFDVTGQEQNALLLAKARSRLKHTAELTQSHPERLPFDDKHFDYVICLRGLECVEEPRALLEELFRVASLGVLLGFPSSWSLRGLGRIFCSGQKGAQPFCPGARRAIAPPRLRSWLPENVRAGKIRWAAALLGPACTWAPRRLRGLWERLNFMTLPLPVGAFSLARIDLTPAEAGAQIIIKARHPLAGSAPAGGLSKSG